MVQCCRCNGSGLCKNCSCVKAGKACVDCLPSKRQRCSNTCHQPCPLSPIPSPPAAQPRSDTSPQRATPRHDALQLMQQQGTPTSQPCTNSSSRFYRFYQWSIPISAYQDQQAARVQSSNWSCLCLGNGRFSKLH